MQELAKRDKKYVLLLVGGGPEDKRLKQMVADFGLEQNVIFTGRVPHDEVANYYDLIDLLVFPRKSMRLTELVTPLKPLEAMAQRKLVLASDVGGHHELITHGENGYLFKADNVADLTRNVEEITSTDNSEVLSNGLTFVKEVRNWAVSVSNYKPIYEALKKH
jgi:glycosyltransferase involved in cell wall biosynthesis